MIFISVFAHLFSAAVVCWAIYSVVKAVTADTTQVRVWWAINCVVAAANLWIMFSFLRGG